jgi:hypothetical protein
MPSTWVMTMVKTSETAIMPAIQRATRVNTGGSVSAGGCGVMRRISLGAYVFVHHHT